VRLLHVTHSHPKYPGDATAPFIASIISALARRGHEVDVVLPHHPEFAFAAVDGVRYFPYRYSPTDRLGPWGFGGTLRGSSRLDARSMLLFPGVALGLSRMVRRLLSSGDYSAVNAHWLLPNAWLAASPATKKHVPLVVSLHGSDISVAEKNTILRSIARRTFTMAAGVTACSDDLHRRAVDLGAAPGSTQTIHYGVDTDSFLPRSPDSGERTKLGAVDDSTLLAVAVGRLVEKKGFRYLVDAVGQVDGVHLAILGDGDLRSELEQQIRASSAPVSLIGEVDRHSVAAALGAADVVAVPSVVDAGGNVDGLPNTLLEALAAGRPVVASAIAGIPEVVTDDENGLLVPAKDVEALALALGRLRDQPELRDRLGAEARNRALRELDWDATARAFEEVYRTASAPD
jgi:glycosyltransferase involved in cell wall biosynthesis